jgi:hypothetical protein
VIPTNSVEIIHHYFADALLKGPVPELAANKPNWPRVGRDNNLKECYAHMAGRLRGRESAKGNPGVKEYNPLIALQSSPGGGKSFFLDQLALCDETDLRNFCEDKKMREILTNSVAIRVTFNGETYVRDESEESKKPIHYLCLRILFR